MDTRLYSVVDGVPPAVYRTGALQTTTDGVDLASAAAFYHTDASSGAVLPSCHQLRSPRTATSAALVDNLDPVPVSRDFVARAFYDGRTGGPASFWDRRRASFLADGMAPPGVIGGYDGTTTGDNRRSYRGDSIIGGKDTPIGPGCGTSTSATNITSSLTSSVSSSSRRKKPIGRS